MTALDHDKLREEHTPRIGDPDRCMCGDLLPCDVITLMNEVERLARIDRMIEVAENEGLPYPFEYHEIRGDGTGYITVPGVPLPLDILDKYGLREATSIAGLSCVSCGADISDYAAGSTLCAICDPEVDDK